MHYNQGHQETADLDSAELGAAARMDQHKTWQGPWHPRQCIRRVGEGIPDASAQTMVDHCVQEIAMDSCVIRPTCLRKFSMPVVEDLIGAIQKLVVSKNSPPAEGGAWECEARSASAGLVLAFPHSTQACKLNIRDQHVAHKETACGRGCFSIMHLNHSHQANFQHQSAEQQEGKSGTPC